MKKSVLIPVLIGSTLLLGWAIIYAVNYKKDDVQQREERDKSQRITDISNILLSSDSSLSQSEKMDFISKLSKMNRDELYNVHLYMNGEADENKISNIFKKYNIILPS